MWQTEIIVTLILDDGDADARLHAAHIVQLALGVLLECPLMFGPSRAAQLGRTCVIIARNCSQL